MKKLLIASASLFFGIAIVLVSLFSANITYSQGEDLEFSKRRLYISNNIMPDHLFYPMIVGFDRLKLKTSSPELRPWIKFVYAQRRVDQSEGLLKKGYRGLAFSTLSKACKYHTQALVELKDGNNNEDKIEIIRQEHQDFKERVEFLRSSFLDSDQQELDRLLAEQELIFGSS